MSAAWPCSSTPMCATSGRPTSSSLCSATRAPSWSERVTCLSTHCPRLPLMRQSPSSCSTRCWRSSTAWLSMPWRCTTGLHAQCPSQSACPSTTSTSPRPQSSSVSARCGRYTRPPLRRSRHTSCRMRTCGAWPCATPSWSASLVRLTAHVPSSYTPARCVTRGGTRPSGASGSSLRWRMATRTRSGRCCGSRGPLLPATPMYSCNQRLMLPSLPSKSPRTWRMGPGPSGHGQTLTVWPHSRSRPCSRRQQLRRQPHPAQHCLALSALE
mmetsp:Transcript_8812/g.18857  ORF Transcript_8812/g.18857 Transcript_8812/m.18857 type:complete len:269 (+) Transcript_8812:1367-2173(+)